jgi:Kef-type K+ transport system membrane component KefB
MSFSFPIENHILQFTLLITAALLVQITIERLKLPGLIGLLLIGIAIGPGALGMLPREPVAELMGELGLVYIMFLAGIEINLSVVQKHRREVAGFGVLSFGITFAAALMAGWWLQFSWQGALLLATALSSHTLVAYPVVKQMQLMQRQPVVTAIGGTLVTDTLALISLAILVETAGQGDDGAWAWLKPLALLAVLAAIAAFIVPRLARRMFASEQIQRAEKALFVLVVLLVLASAARVIGTESILGAFLAGVCLNPSIRGRHELHEHLGFVGRMVFIPFFFIDTGMRIEASVLLQSEVWTMAAAMIAAVLLAKSAAAWAIGHHYGYGRGDRLLMIGLSTPQAAATLAVTVTASRIGAIDGTVVDAVVVVILVTCLFGPLLARFAGRKVSQDKEPASPAEDPHVPMG